MLRLITGSENLRWTQEKAFFPLPMVSYKEIALDQEFSHNLHATVDIELGELKVCPLQVGNVPTWCAKLLHLCPTVCTAALWTTANV